MCVTVGVIVRVCDMWVWFYVIVHLWLCNCMCVRVLCMSVSVFVTLFVCVCMGDCLYGWLYVRFVYVSMYVCDGHVCVIVYVCDCLCVPLRVLTIG